tara:strand:+ start:3632 stop:6586 length:2955 start_codon:yes stop_codon:yes gene_type:complete
MGVAGQIFAARVAIGLAIPSPRALSETGGVLVKGISAIYGRLDKKRIENQKKRVSDAEAELNASKKALADTSSSFGDTVASNSQKAVKKLMAAGGRLHEEFRKYGVSAFSKLSEAISADTNKALRSGITKDMSNSQRVMKMTENFAKMTKSQQKEIIDSSARILKTKERALRLTKKSAIAEAKNAQKQFEAGKITEEQYTNTINSINENIKRKEEAVAVAKEEKEIIGLIAGTINTEYNKAVEDMNKKEERVTKSKKKLKDETQKLKDMFSQQSQKAKELAKTIAVNVNGATEAYSDVLRNTISVLTGFFYKLNQSTQALIEFERELLNANSVFNVTRDDLFATADVITNFGQQFGLEMQNGATGLYQLASAGLDAEEALKVLPETLKLSMAVQGDHNTISKLTTQTIAGFGMEMDDAALLTDKFAHAIQKSLIEYEDLSSAVKFALPFFTATGQSIDQLLGALQILTNRALEAGIAGRGLRQALAEFAENADNNEAAFAKMGISIRTSTGEMKQLTEIAAEFAQVVGEDTVSNTELLSALIDDLNVRGATAFVHLVQASDEFTEAVRNTENAGGELDEMVRIQNESMSAQIQILKNNVLAMFFLRDAAYEGTEFMNGFHEAIVTTIRTLSNLLVIQTENGSQLTDLGLTLRDVAINGVQQMGLLLKDLVELIKDFSQAGIVSTDMLKVYLVPFKILLGIVKALGPDLTKLIVTLYVYNKALALSRISQFLFNSTMLDGIKSVGAYIGSLVLLTFTKHKNTKAVKANILMNFVYQKMLKRGLSWQAATTAANYALGASLVVATAGLILLIPLGIAFVNWLRNAKDESFIFGQILGNTVEAIKALGLAIINLFVPGESDAMGEFFFKLGMFINNTILAVHALGEAIKDALSGGWDAVGDVLGFQTGGMMPSYATGGMALVGERGPELVKLPGAAQVLNNTKTNSIMNRAFDDVSTPTGAVNTPTTLKDVKIVGASLSLDTFKGGM